MVEPAENDPPTDDYPKPPFATPQQDEPGWTFAMNPKPDHGEESYVGRGKLKDKCALITGADSGIGRATAIAFAREGADIVMTYLAEEERDAEETARILKEAGSSVFQVPGDISDESFCRHLVKTAVEKFGKLDLLVNIAGKQITQSDISKISSKQLEATFRVNVFSLFWLCDEAISHMKPGASIINTASIQSYEPSPILLDYASTKAAIVAFTKALAKQVADKGIRVNAVAPGPIWTPLQPSHGQPPEKVAKFGENTVFGRPGQPAEVAPTYVFLASNQESSFITAEVIGVTGGRHLP